MDFGSSSSVFVEASSTSLGFRILEFQDPFDVYPNRFVVKLNRIVNREVGSVFSVVKPPNGVSFSEADRIRRYLRTRALAINSDGVCLSVQATSKGLPVYYRIRDILDLKEFGFNFRPDITTKSFNNTYTFAPIVGGAGEISNLLDTSGSVSDTLINIGDNLDEFRNKLIIKSDGSYLTQNDYDKLLAGQTGVPVIVDANGKPVTQKTYDKLLTDRNDVDNVIKDAHGDVVTQAVYDNLEKLLLGKNPIVNADGKIVLQADYDYLTALADNNVVIKNSAGDVVDQKSYDDEIIRLNKLIKIKTSDTKMQDEINDTKKTLNKTRVDYNNLYDRVMKDKSIMVKRLSGHRTLKSRFISFAQGLCTSAGYLGDCVRKFSRAVKDEKYAYKSYAYANTLSRVAKNSGFPIKYSLAKKIKDRTAKMCSKHVLWKNSSSNTRKAPNKFKKTLQSYIDKLDKEKPLMRNLFEYNRISHGLRTQPNLTSGDVLRAPIKPASRVINSMMTQVPVSNFDDIVFMPILHDSEHDTDSGSDHTVGYESDDDSDYEDNDSDEDDDSTPVKELLQLKDLISVVEFGGNVGPFKDVEFVLDILKTFPATEVNDTIQVTSVKSDVFLDKPTDSDFTTLPGIRQFLDPVSIRNNVSKTDLAATGSCDSLFFLSVPTTIYKGQRFTVARIGVYRYLTRVSVVPVEVDGYAGNIARPFDDFVGPFQDVKMLAHILRKYMTSSTATEMAFKTEPSYNYRTGQSVLRQPTTDDLTKLEKRLQVLNPSSFHLSFSSNGGGVACDHVVDMLDMVNVPYIVENNSRFTNHVWSMEGSVTTVLIELSILPLRLHGQNTFRSIFVQRNKT